MLMKILRITLCFPNKRIWDGFYELMFFAFIVASFSFGISFFIFFSSSFPLCLYLSIYLSHEIPFYEDDSYLFPFLFLFLYPFFPCSYLSSFSSYFLMVICQMMNYLILLLTPFSLFLSILFIRSLCLSFYLYLDLMNAFYPFLNFDLFLFLFPSLDLSSVSRIFEI